MSIPDSRVLQSKRKPNIYIPSPKLVVEDKNKNELDLLINQDAIGGTQPKSLLQSMTKVIY